MNDGKTLGISIPADEWWAAVEQELEATRAGAHVAGGITAPEFISAYQGIAFANCFGRVLDVKLDVTWSLVGINGEAAVAQANRQLLSCLDSWCAGMGSASIYVWTLEWGTTRGLHTHMMLSLTDLMLFALNELCLRWISEISGRPHEKIAKETFLLRRDEEGFGAQWTRFRYMMKGLSAHAVIEAPEGLIPLDRFAGIERHFQGDVTVQRIGCAASIDGPARSPYADSLPDMSLRVDGPQLYGDRFLDFHRARLAEPHFKGELAPRNAHHLVLTPPFA